ncbi:MAG: UDP-N-acetylmuramoyl-L-alanine--D-glutamate ligase [Reyranellaceae bacterium]
MIDLAALQKSRFAVLGLARSGLATARALQAAGIDYAAWDDDAAKRDAAQAQGVRIADPLQADWSAMDALVISPGIPHTFPQPHPVASRAKQARKPIIGDIELLARAAAPAGAKFVGITGTNGKSTTTALIGHVLKQAGRRVEVGGNLGQPALDFAMLGRDGIYVLEMSSYQLELVEHLRCNVAVLLNVTPDHLDRHGGMAGYIAAKRHIFDNQTADDAAVIGIDSEPTRALAEELARQGGRKIVRIAVGHQVAGGVYAIDGVLHDGDTGFAVDLRPILTLPGAHNWQNACAAYAACRALGVASADIAAGLRSYPGLPHRQERVAEIAGIAYVNDSKATNADAAEKALSSYDTIYWIAGGRPKEGGIEPLRPHFPRLAHAFLIGEAADGFAATLQGAVAFTQCGTLEKALQAAHALAQRERRSGAVVLLSPACASWDQWPSFEARGDAFRAQAQALAKGEAA